MAGSSAYRSFVTLVASSCFLLTQLAIPALAQDASTTPATSTPTDVNLSSSAANIQFNPSNGQSVTIIQGDNQSVLISPLQYITAGQYAAAKQVLHTGQQSVVLGADGTVTGGQVNIGYLVRNFPTSSLTVPQNVTALNNQGDTGVLATTGNITNYGSLYAYSTNPNVTTATINANNIFNGGLISTALTQSLMSSIGGNLVANMNLTMNAANNIVNAGSIVSAGNLNLNAGQSIINQATTAGVTAVLQAQNNVTLNSAIGNIVNSGNITATLGNINVVSNAVHDLMFNNLGGTLSALNGAVNLRDSSYSAYGNLSVLGGDIISKELNLYSGGGEINLDVNNVTGVVSSYAGAAHITAATPSLVLGDQMIIGDPTWYNSAGDVLIAGNIFANSGSRNVAIVARGNIVSITGAGSIDASSIRTTGAGGAITIIAGATITPAGSSSTGSTGVINLFNMSAGGTGGGIYLDGTAPTGFSGGTAAAITGLTSSGVPSGVSGGNVYLGAYQGTGAGSGIIRLPSTLTIDTTGSGNGNTSGSVTIHAGAAAGTSISIGSIDTSGTNRANAGSVTILTATPEAGFFGKTINSGALSSPMSAGTARAAGIDIAGSITASGSNGNTGTLGTDGAAIVIGNASTSSLTVGGTIASNGGAGGNGANGVTSATPTAGSVGQAGSTGGDITLRGGTITINGDISALGGNGGNGGRAGDDLSGNQDGRNGGNGQIGGDAGAISITSNVSGITLGGSVFAVGGNGGSGGIGGDTTGAARNGGTGGSGSTAGRGNTIDIGSAGPLTVAGDIFSRSGVGGAGGTGGASGNSGNSDGGNGGSGGASQTGGAITITSASTMTISGGISSSAGGGGRGGDGGAGLRDGGNGGNGGTSAANSGAISITGDLSGISIAGNVNSSQGSGGAGGTGGSGTNRNGGDGGDGGAVAGTAGNVTIVGTNAGVVTLGNVLANGAARGTGGAVGTGGGAAAGATGTGTSQPGTILLRSDQTNNGTPLLINGYISGTSSAGLGAINAAKTITISGSRVSLYGTGVNVGGTNYSIYGGSNISITGNGSSLINLPSVLNLSSSSTTASGIATSPFVAASAATTSSSNGSINGMATRTAISINGLAPTAPNSANSLTTQQSFAPGAGSLSIIENGAQKSFTSASSMTAAEKVAAVQLSAGGPQTLTLNASGLATGGTFTINSNNMPAAGDNGGQFSQIVVPANVTGTIPFSSNLNVTTGVTVNGTLNFSSASGGTMTLGASGLTVGSAGTVSSNGNLRITTPTLTNSGLITGGTATNGRIDILSTGDLDVAGNGTIRVTSVGNQSLGNNIFLSSGPNQAINVNGSLTYDSGNYGYVTWYGDGGTVNFGNNTTQTVQNNALTYVQAPTINFGTNSGISAGTSQVSFNATPGAATLRINAPSGSNATVTSSGMIVIMPQPTMNLVLGTTGAGAGSLTFNTPVSNVIRVQQANATINSGFTLNTNARTDFQMVSTTLTNNGTINNTAGGLSFNNGGQTIGIGGTGAFNGGGIIQVFGDVGTINFNSSLTFNPGAGGVIGMNANNINLNNGAVVTASNGSAMIMAVDNLTFTNGSGFVSTATTANGFTVYSNFAGPMNINGPSGGSAGFTTSGGGIGLYPTGGIVFGGIGSTLNFNGGRLDVNTNSSPLTIASNVTLSSNRNISLNASTFTDNGNIISSNPGGNITIKGYNLSMNGTPGTIALTGGGAGTIDVWGYDQSALTFNSSYAFNAGAAGTTSIYVPAGTLAIGASRSISATGGGILNVNARGINFGSGSSLISQATTGNGLNVTAPYTDLTVTVNGNAQFQTSGADVTVAPPGGGVTLRFTTGTTGTLTISGGTITINSVDPAQISSNFNLVTNNRTINVVGGGLTNNGILDAGTQNINFSGQNINVSGAGTLFSNAVTFNASGLVSATQATISGVVSGTAVNGLSTTVSGAGGLTVGNLSTTNGSINLIANGGMLRVNAGSIISANEGNLLIQNANEATGFIRLEAGSQVGAFTAGNLAFGSTTIVVGAVPATPILGGKPALVTENKAGGGEIYYGTMGIVALGSPSVVNALGRNVVFSTNSRNGSAITLAGGNTVTADPPVAGATLLYGHLSAGGAAGASGAASAADSAAAAVNSATPGNILLQQPAPVTTGGAENAVQTVSYNQGMSAPVIPTNTFVKGSTGSGFLPVGEGSGFGSGSAAVALASGEAVLSSEDGPRHVDLGSATVMLPEKAVALVEKQGSLSKVRVLVDSAVVKIGKRSVELNAGQEIVVAANEDELLSATAGDGVGRRFTRQFTVDGHEVLYGDFSIMSLIPRSEVMTALRFSENKQERALFERVMKMSACLYVVTAKHGQYKEYRGMR